MLHAKKEKEEDEHLLKQIVVFIPEYLFSKKAPELTRRLHLFPAKSFSHPLRVQKYRINP